MADKTPEIKVAGHLYEKRGIYQIILSWADELGKRHRKSISTGLKVKGNKKKAEKMLAEMRSNYEAALQKEPSSGIHSQTLFADFAEYWLEEVKKNEVMITTYSGYQFNIKSKIAPYFRERGILLADITADDINAFYDEMYKTCKAETVLHFHANIIQILKYVKKRDVIDGLKRPKPEKFKANYLRRADAIRVFEAIQGHALELGVIMGAYYGLRRSEVVGLKWSSIDFDSNTISIEHTVVRVRVDGKNIEVCRDTTKSESSYRTLPLVPEYRAKLLEVKAEQERNRQLCGNSYSKDRSGYIYTDKLGNRISPEYLTKQFPIWMVKNGFERLRFHDLRHPYVKPPTKNLLQIL